MYPITSKIIYFESLNSTNDYLISLYKELNINKEYVVVTNHQLKGRGRRNKSWFSNEDSLTFSFSFQLQDNLNSWTLSMSVSLALIRLLLNGVSLTSTDLNRFNDLSLLVILFICVEYNASPSINSSSLLIT